MGPNRISQPKSLSTDYTVGQQDVGSASGPGKLGGHTVEQEKDGVARARRTQGSFVRFQGRLKAGLQSFRSVFQSANTVANQQATRFNARHEKFSESIQFLTAQLKSGDASSVGNADAMAALRHEVKLLHQDARWASREQLLATRLDVEFSKLSDAELATVKDSLMAADTSSLTSRDKVDLDRMKQAVLRQTVARSPEMAAVFSLVKPDDASSTTELPALRDALKDLNTIIEQGAADLQLRTVNGSNPERISSGAMSVYLRRNPPTKEQLPEMNRHVLNLIRSGKPLTGSQTSERNDPLILLGRAVRETFLKSLTTEFTDERLVSRMKKFGSGAAHTVTKTKYEIGGGGDGTETQRTKRVHKYDDETLGGFSAASAIGVDRHDPRLLERAVFSSKYDKALGFNVTVGTDLALNRDRLGIVMELAPGRIASHGQRTSPNDAVLQRELVKLQLLDALLGQTDRHTGNYMVLQDPHGGVLRVVAIDNDFCMGSKTSDLSTVIGQQGIHLTNLPPVVDTEMAEAIRSMTPEKLQEMAGGMFDDVTLKAAEDRLNAVKAHLDKLELAGRMIDSSEWGSEKVTELLNEPSEEYGSYWQRDQEIFIQGMGDPFLEAFM